MSVKPEDVRRVVAFRGRLVAFANYVNAQVHRHEHTPDEVQSHVAGEQAWLSQEYGRITPLIGRYGLAMMHRYNMVVSQDVVRDAIQTPAHPGYGDLAQMAIGHLDMIIGQLRAEIEDGAARRSWDADAFHLRSRREMSCGVGLPATLTARRARAATAAAIGSVQGNPAYTQESASPTTTDVLACPCEIVPAG